jgi:hypothetical protein
LLVQVLVQWCLIGYTHDTRHCHSGSTTSGSAGSRMLCQTHSMPKKLMMFAELAPCYQFSPVTGPAGC